MKKLTTLFLLSVATLSGFCATSTSPTPTYNSVTKRVSPSSLWPSNGLAIASGAAPFLGAYVDPRAQFLPTKNRFSVLASNTVPWRIGGFGDSLGDDIVAQWAADFGRGIGFNGGYLTVFTNTLFAPLTYTFTGNTTIPLPDTNWFAAHWTMGVGGAAADVTFDSAGRFLVADTFRVAMVHSTNGGTYKIQVCTNGGAFTDVSATLSALSANPTGVVVNFSTNLGEWKLRVVNVAGTNVLVGGGIWASNRGGISPSQMWSYGGTLADVTNVSTNIVVPILRSVGLTEFFWHALDVPTLITNAIPLFCTTLAMAGNAPTNTDGVFIGTCNVTDNSSRYDLGNEFIQAYVTGTGYSFVSLNGLGTTNDLVRRQWTTDPGCIHLNTLGLWYLADSVWRNGGFQQEMNVIASTYLGSRVPFRVLAGLSQSANLFEWADYGGTNAGYISKDGYIAIGPRLTGTFMLDVFGNAFFGRTNFSTQIGFARLNSSSSLSHSILFDSLNANTATVTYEKDSGRLTLNSAVGVDICIDADNNQTVNAFTISKDAANPTNATKLFQVQENGGGWIVAGQSTSNAYLGGTMYYSVTPLAAGTGSPTTLNTFTVPAHTLTNNGDRLVAEWDGVTISTAANTNALQLYWANNNVCSTGLLPCSNTTWRASLKVTRTGTGTQHLEGHIEWGPGGGVPFPFTNMVSEIAIDAGVANAIQVRASSTAVGGITNTSMFVEYKPGPK